MNTKNQTVRNFSRDTGSKHILTNSLVRICLLFVSLEKVLTVLFFVFMGKRLSFFKKFPGDTKDQTVFHFCMQTDKRNIKCFPFVCLENI